MTTSGNIKRSREGPTRPTPLPRFGSCHYESPQLTTGMNIGGTRNGLEPRGDSEKGLWSRRKFISATTAAACTATAGCSTLQSTREIIDCHTHFYDPARPQGVPWPSPTETQLYRRVLPADYRKLAEPLGITGTMVVEASEWITDNDWALELAAHEPFLLGLVGNVAPGNETFRKELKRLAANPMLRGIRVRGTDASRVNESSVVRDLKLLADSGLALDFNAGPELLGSVVKLSASIPDLRIIIDHVANVRIDGKTPPKNWREGMRAAGERSNIYCKVSGLAEGSGRRKGAPSDVNFYRPVLDHIWECFGPTRLIYGSNWPVCELFAELATVHSIACSYFAEHGPDATRNVFALNCHRFYRPPGRGRAG